MIVTITLLRIWRDERRVLDGQPVGQLHQHLGRSGLAAVQAAHQVVDRLGLAMIVARLRVGERRADRRAGRDSRDTFEVRDGLLGGDDDDFELAAFVGRADRRGP